MRFLIFFSIFIYSAKCQAKVTAREFLDSCPSAKLKDELKIQLNYSRRQDKANAFSSLNPTLNYGHSNNDFGSSTDRVRYGIQLNHVNPFTINNKYKSAKHLAEGMKNQYHHLMRESIISKAQMLFEWIARYQLYKDLGFIVDLRRKKVPLDGLTKEQLKELFIEDSYVEDLKINKNKLKSLTQLFNNCDLMGKIDANPLNISIPSPEKKAFTASLDKILERETAIINSFCENERLGNQYLQKEKDKFLDPGLFAGFNKVEPQGNDNYDEWRIGLRVNINFTSLAYKKNKHIITQCDLNKDKMLITEKRAYDIALAKQERIPRLLEAFSYLEEKTEGFKVAYVNNKIKKMEIGSFINQYTIILFKLSENLSNAYSTYIASKINEQEKTND